MKKSYDNQEEDLPITATETATIFFIPKVKDDFIMGDYRHMGIIYNGKVYEAFRDGTYSIGNEKRNLPILTKKEKATFLQTEIIPEKLEQEIKSETSCEQFVLRVMGMSMLKGKDRSNLYPQDIYNIIKNKKNIKVGKN